MLLLIYQVIHQRLYVKCQTYWVKHVRLAQLSLKVSRTSQDHSCNIDFVVGHKELHSRLSHFSNIVVSLLHSQTSKTKSRLSSSSWEIHLKKKQEKKRKAYLKIHLQHQSLLSNDTKSQVLQEHGGSVPCFLGRSTVNLCSTSRVLPCSVPNSAPLPSITIKPNLLSSESKAVNACVKRVWKNWVILSPKTCEKEIPKLSKSLQGWKKKSVPRYRWQ